MLPEATPSVAGFRERITGFDWDVVPLPKKKTRAAGVGLVTYCQPS